MRLAMADVFWRSGLTKLPFGSDITIMLFRDEHRIAFLPPEMAAYLATIVEPSCPVLLVLGIFARPAAAILLAQTIVIRLFVDPQNHPDHLL